MKTVNTATRSASELLEMLREGANVRRRRLTELSMVAQRLRRKSWFQGEGRAEVIEAIFDCERDVILWDVARAIGD